MGGGLMQLVAYGAQDVYLTGNPQITFFKVVYRRHTNFSMECIEQPLDSSRFGGRHTVQVLRNGDLAGRMYLKTTLPGLTATNGQVCWIRRVGHALIDNIECTVGGSQVDKHWGTWYDVWYELTHTNEQERGYGKMIGDTAENTTLAASVAQSQLYVPLQFWFNRNTGLALPLIALQYHEVRFNIQFAQLADLVCKTSAASYTGADLNDTSILVDYIYLDQEERRRMAQVGHEYLIEQLQFNGAESVTGVNQRVKLDFNHPCKELIWAVRTNAMADGNEYLAHFQTSREQVIADAANHVAAGMVSTSTGTNWSAVDLSGVSTQTAGIVTVQNNNTVFHFVVQNDSSANGPSNILYVNGSTALSAVCTKVVEVNADVTINAAGDAVVSNVTAVNHSLTIDDVSAPVSNLGIDNRDTTATAADVVVNQPFNYGSRLDGTGVVVDSAKLQLNGHDRFDEQKGDYFNYVQPHQHHTRTPADGIFVYSFGLNPEQHQPSGTANLSRIDTTMLNLKFTDAVKGGDGSLLWIFAFSYNVFRIMSGMGGLAYAN